jgi:hypothetical protein
MIIDDKRALAYIVNCGRVFEIVSADNIALAEVNGWKVIIKKNEISEGDKCVFFEIDSKLPEAEWSEFLRPKHFKIKTMKLSKFNAISQGLLMPITLFPELADMEVGTDVTDILKVTYSVVEDNTRKSKNGDPDVKYKSMAQRHQKIFKKPIVRKIMKHKLGRKIMFLFFGKKKDKPLSFPTHFPFVHKTDEERCENMPWVLGYERPLIVTEKLDGTSSTYILERKGKKKFEFYVLSRNVRQKTPDQKCYHDKNIYWDMAIKNNIEQHLKEYLVANPDLKYVCIQGESVGSVQGNPLKLNEDELYVFNFIRSDVGRLSSIDGKEIIESWGMKFVPILETEYYVPTDMEAFKEYATAKSVVNPNVLREGIVLRDPTNDFSFKNVSREYLLKHGG